MKKLAIAYFGTPYFSARLLEKLIDDNQLKNLVDIKFVFTQPDKPVGKKHILTPTPVKQTAEKHHLTNLKFRIQNLELEKNNKILNFKKNSEFIILNSKLKNIDLALLFAYGKLIPKSLLSLPKYGFWCIHPSLLPKYRGASPIAYPLILGDKKTGVTIFLMDEKIDHGPIIAQQELEILPKDKKPDLEIKLTDLAFAMLKKLLIILSKNCHVKKKIKLINQNHAIATYAPPLTREDGFIPLSLLKKSLKNKPLTFQELPKIIKNYFSKYPISNNQYLTSSSKIIYNLFCGLYPWPGLWTFIPDGRRLKITDMELKDHQPPNINSEFRIHNLALKPTITNRQPIIIKRVQLEGKKEVDFETFNKAYKVF